MESTSITLSADKKPTRVARKSHKQLVRPPFESIALLLQGDGALGAYQGGVYQAISEAHLDPDSIFAGVQRFAQAREERIKSQRDRLSGA